MLNGALLAVDEVNRSAGPVELEASVVDPGGRPSRYSELAADLLQSGIRHVVGCYTSSSRKEVIPVFEKHDSLLWYPSHYEGFETSDNVVYTGAAPNQHILPLIKHMSEYVGRTVCCVGSNYIWAWENNRILREGITALGGRVITERYLPVGETDLAKTIDEIIAVRPDFVFNTLIGDSAYAFFRRFRRACEERGIDQPGTLPVASCSLSEPELEEIGPEAVNGHYSSSVYFASIERPQNRDFMDAYARAFPEGPTVSADAEASYVAVRILAGALERAGTDAMPEVKAAVGGFSVDAPQGSVRIDPSTLHAYLTPRIGRSNADARFDIVMSCEEPVAPDPYLIGSTPRFAVSMRPGNLRIVQ
jgi:branched-chain amino acid transport system substrate-binding protein